MGPIMSDETKIHHSSLCLSQDLGTGISVGAFALLKCSEIWQGLYN